MPIHSSHTKVDQLIKYLPSLLSDISKKDDEQIIRIVINAQRLERFAFLLRGVCASILRQRHQHRLTGGRGKRDQAGIGIQAHMNRLAQQAGVDRKTLETDARIRDTFFPMTGETRLEHIPTLRREYYVIALAAPDPQAAIRIAIEKCAETNYRLREFRDEVRTLRPIRASSAKHATPAHTSTLCVRIPAEVNHLITELMAMTEKTKDDLIADAICAFHASLTKSPNRRTGAARPARSTHRIHGNEQLELEM